MSADVYAEITRASVPVLERLAEILERRGTDPQQERIRQAYFSDIPFPENARVLESGCGTGAVVRALADWPGVGEVVGTDPSEFFLNIARDLAKFRENVRFNLADARNLPFPDETFDVAVFHTTLCHVPSPEKALEEAWRVLRPNGILAVFDADYSSTTLAQGPQDPLQAVAEAAISVIAYDPYLGRRLAPLVHQTGFEITQTRSFGYCGVEDSDYMLTLVDRGADALLDSKRVGPELAAALKNEARRRVQAGNFFGRISYSNIIARKVD